MLSGRPNIKLAFSVPSKLLGSEGAVTAPAATVTVIVPHTPSPVGDGSTSASEVYDERRSANTLLVATFCGIFGLVALAGIVVLLWKRCLARSVREEKRRLLEMGLRAKERESDVTVTETGGYDLGGIMRVATYPGPRVTLPTSPTSTTLSPPAAAAAPAPYNYYRGGDFEMTASDEKKGRRMRGWGSGESGTWSGYGGGDEEHGVVTGWAGTGPRWGVSPPWDVAGLYDYTRPAAGADGDSAFYRVDERRLTLPGTMSRTLPKIVAQTPHRGGIVGGPGYRPSVRRAANREPPKLARGRARIRFDPNNVI